MADNIGPDHEVEATKETPLRASCYNLIYRVRHRLYLHYFTIYLHVIDMPTSCCFPQCNQQGFTTPTGEKVSYFSFPSLLLRRKQWIHAIRREEGKHFKIFPSATKVCSLHFRPEDLWKSLSGRIYVADGAIPSKFAWSIPSPRKRKHLLFASH